MSGADRLEEVPVGVEDPDNIGSLRITEIHGMKLRLKSRPLEPHPLFRAFVAAALKRGNPSHASDKHKPADSHSAQTKTAKR